MNYGVCLQGQRSGRARPVAVLLREQAPPQQQPELIQRARKLPKAAVLIPHDPEDSGNQSRLPGSSGRIFRVCVWNETGRSNFKASQSTDERHEEEPRAERGISVSGAAAEGQRSPGALDGAAAMS